MRCSTFIIFELVFCVADEIAKMIVPYFAPLRTPCQKNSPLSDEFQPGDHDVICGRGKQSYNTTGNRRFRLMITVHMRRYLQAYTKLDKSLVVISIVDVVRSNGGGFVKRCPKTKKWLEIGDQLAREKVGHALRDAISAREAEGLNPAKIISAESITIEDLMRLDAGALEQFEKLVKSGVAARPIKFVPKGSSPVKPDTYSSSMSSSLPSSMSSSLSSSISSRTGSSLQSQTVQTGPSTAVRETRSRTTRSSTNVSGSIVCQPNGGSAMELQTSKTDLTETIAPTRDPKSMFETFESSAHSASPPQETQLRREVSIDIDHAPSNESRQEETTLGKPQLHHHDESGDKLVALDDFLLDIFRQEGEKVNSRPYAGTQKDIEMTDSSTRYTQQYSVGSLLSQARSVVEGTACTSDDVPVSKKVVEVTPIRLDNFSDPSEEPLFQNFIEETFFGGLTTSSERTQENLQEFGGVQFGEDARTLQPEASRSKRRTLRRSSSLLSLISMS